MRCSPQPIKLLELLRAHPSNRASLSLLSIAKSPRNNLCFSATTHQQEWHREPPPRAAKNHAVSCVSDWVPQTCQHQKLPASHRKPKVHRSWKKRSRQSQEAKRAATCHRQTRAVRGYRKVGTSDGARWAAQSTTAVLPRFRSADHLEEDVPDIYLARLLLVGRFR